MNNTETNLQDLNGKDFQVLYEACKRAVELYAEEHGFEKLKEAFSDNKEGDSLHE